MTELSTTQLFCGDCGTALVKKPGGGKPTYCKPCARVRVRTNVREYQQRRRAGIKLEIEPLPCAGCGTMFMPARAGKQQTDKCKPCRERRFDEYQRAHRLAQGHAPIGSTITIVCACGNVFDRIVTKGRPAWKCQVCLRLNAMVKLQRNSATRRLRTPAPDLARICLDCGMGFQQRSPRCRRIERCTPCAKARAERLKREYGKAASIVFVEARRIAFEVNGRWSPCRRCGVRIAQPRVGVRQWCDTCLPLRQLEVGRAWRLANPEKQKELMRRANRARRARLNSVPSEPFSDLYIWERDKWICQLCHKRINKKLGGMDLMGPTVDHQIPLVLGGPDTPANAVAAHRTCNTSKGHRYLPGGEQLALLG